MTRDELILAAIPALITERGFACNELATKGIGVDASEIIIAAAEIADAYYEVHPEDLE